ncbi:hypothetical protein KZC56_17320 [Microbacterium sp. SSW1-47]|uniref:hypothetical protein n=1 Tax=Microbacterium sufflavum TaxID=2851649 RepID=UPI001FFD8331|nr:hypothetical protein [Microbacterium sufflavum]MCK2028060.1 hypothetical protein [Microbacterium sufflavum]
MSDASEEEPRYYSQATAAAMDRELTEARVRIRQLETLVGILNREAEEQAERVAELREDVSRWQGRYVQARAAEIPNEK